RRSSARETRTPLAAEHRSMPRHSSP
ncbi:hypothetical protein KKC1_33340, partial [Calderihabitans maritimus]